MFELILDVAKSRVYIDLYGTFSSEHIQEYIENLNKITKTIPPNLCSVLVMENRLDPLPQYYIPYIKEAAEILIPWANKIAVVHGNRTITKIQMKRISEEAKIDISSNMNIMRFKTKNDALKFLNWTD